MGRSVICVCDHSEKSEVTVITQQVEASPPLLLLDDTVSAKTQEQQRRKANFTSG